MAHEIKKLKFKQNANVQIEVVYLDKLTANNKIQLIKPHRTDFYHVFIFENCQPTHFVDFEPIAIQPYSLLFINKDRVHQFDQQLGYKGLGLIFTDNFFCNTETDTKFLRSSILFDDLVDKPTIKLSKKGLEKYLKLCNSISEELILPADNLMPKIVKNLLHNFLLLAEREKYKQGFKALKKGADIDYTLLFRDLLEANYTKLKSVNDYAKIMCISEKRLGQATTNVLGKTPKEIINDRILLEAKRFLAHTHLSIKEIGIDLGFDDPAYFVRYFKKNTKTTPVEFRALFF